MTKCEVCGKKLEPVIRKKTCSDKCRSKKHYLKSRANKGDIRQ